MTKIALTTTVLVLGTVVAVATPPWMRGGGGGDMPPFGEGGNNAGIARWMTEQSLWGTLSAPGGSGSVINSFMNALGRDPTSLSVLMSQDAFGTTTTTSEFAPSLMAGTVPLATDEETGRIFFYLMGGETTTSETVSGAALTLSQAALDPALFGMGACGSMESAVDARSTMCQTNLTGGPLSLCYGRRGL